MKFSVYSLTGIANIGEGMGDFLLPVGVLYSGPRHPDSMELSHADMLCLDMSAPGIPQVAVWYNDRGAAEAFDRGREALRSLTTAE